MSEAPTTFEAKLARIEAIVKELESGQATLDRQLELYREGKTLERECDALLKNAEKELARAAGQEIAKETTSDETPF